MRPTRNSLNDPITPRKLVSGLILLLLATVEPGMSFADDVSGSSANRRAGARALGRLEPAGGLIVVGARPGARIDEIKVKAGDNVEKDAVLAILEGHMAAFRQVELAEAEKARAEKQCDFRKQKLALERESADETLKARLLAAHKTADSVSARYNDATLPFKTLRTTLKDKERYDAEIAYLQLETQTTRTALDLSLLELEQKKTPKQRTLEDDELADKTPFQVLDAQIALARASLAQTEVRAPSAGRVLDLKAHVGEVSSGALLSLGDVSSMVATAEVFQTDVPRVSVGDAAEVRILDRTVPGRVTSIGLLVGRNQVTSLDPRAPQDRRVVDVTVRLDTADVASHYVNMEVDVLIKPDGAATK